MRHLLYDLRFILRNWRYFHAHNALARELRDWWNDYDLPATKPSMDYSIQVNRVVDPSALARITRRLGQSVGQEAI